MTLSGRAVFSQAWQEMERLANAFSVLELDADDDDQARATTSSTSLAKEGTTSSGSFPPIFM